MYEAEDECPPGYSRVSCYTDGFIDVEGKINNLAFMETEALVRDKVKT